MAKKKLAGKRKTKRFAKAGSKAAATRRAPPLRKAANRKPTGKRKAAKRALPETVLFNVRLEKRLMAYARQTAKTHFRGNMSAFVRDALNAWAPRRRVRAAA